MAMDKDESILSDHPTKKWHHQHTEDVYADDGNNADADASQPFCYKRQKTTKVVSSQIVEVQDEPSKGRAVKKAKKLPKSHPDADAKAEANTDNSLKANSPLV
ncbi:hypothetical protein EW146_g6929 [Bondarzewia mesenterica]|uniref:Uncharacterized protein n=1 Tax=Bondarzewia mesenterica TaxID=1095465 RepID=A0A4S4LP18_9AGAM|nr:hypothetical protein EW146_g6929 [Bondarzewia mesenterica]